MIAAAAIFLNINTASAITRDSIGVENNKGKKVVIHKVVAKDTYYSIARRYNVNPKDVMSFNESKYLQIGVIIKVPTGLPFQAEASAGSTAMAGQTPDKNADKASTSDGNESGLVEHTIQKKENLNMLAERYGTTVNEIKRINNLKTINLQIGQVLKIPVKPEDQQQPEETPATAVQPKVTPTAVPAQTPSQTAVTPPQPEKAGISKNIDLNAREKQKDKPADDEELIVHTVASNETIYSIATKYNLTIDQLKAKNDLTSSSLNVGQQLLIKGKYPVKPAYVAPGTEPANPDSARSIKDPSLRLPASRYGLNQIDEKGTAVWISDPDLDPSKMLVLHRTAPIGTIIKITNPMTNRSALAKVVGKFTENESTKDVIIVVTKAVADSLGALDKRFFCNLIYGAQENEQ